MNIQSLKRSKINSRAAEELLNITAALALKKANAYRYSDGTHSAFSADVYLTVDLLRATYGQPSAVEAVNLQSEISRLSAKVGLAPSSEPAHDVIRILELLSSAEDTVLWFEADGEPGSVGAVPDRALGVDSRIYEIERRSGQDLALANTLDRVRVMLPRRSKESYLTTVRAVARKFGSIVTATPFEDSAHAWYATVIVA